MMKHKQRTENSHKKNTVLLTLLLLISVLFSLYYIAMEADHDCAGEDCPICIFLALCEENIRTIKTGILLIAACIFTFHGLTALIPVRKTDIPLRTPVSLKVQMNN